MSVFIEFTPHRLILPLWKWPKMFHKLVLIYFSDFSTYGHNKVVSGGLFETPITQSFIGVLRLLRGWWKCELILISSTSAALPVLQRWCWEHWPRVLSQFCSFLSPWALWIIFSVVLSLQTPEHVTPASLRQEIKVNLGAAAWFD